MGEMERSLWNASKERHDALVATLIDLDRSGYLVNGIGYINGALEIRCYPPVAEDSKELTS
jgi:hypothetical protein